MVLANVIGRWAQRLVVTNFELTTVSFILCSSMTAFFWWRKPADVFLPVTIDSDISISNILEAENQTLTNSLASSMRYDGGIRYSPLDRP